MRVFSINGMPICHVLSSAIQLWSVRIVMFLVEIGTYKVLYL